MGDIETAEASSVDAFPSSKMVFPDPNPRMPRERTRRRPSNIKLPSRLKEKVTSKYNQYLPLHRAISRGDLEAVKDFLNHRPDAITAWIDLFETPLLKACNHGRAEIVKEILQRMRPEQVLTVKEKDGNSESTPLSVAAMSGNLEIAEALIAKNPKLLEIPGDSSLIPVAAAVQNGQEEMARFLYCRTPLQVLLADDGYQGCILLSLAIYYGMLDIALDIFEAFPRLAVTKHPRLDHSQPLDALAEMPELFPCASRLGFWRRLVYSSTDISVNPQTFAETWSSNQHGGLVPKVLGGLSKWFGIYEMKEMHCRAQKLLTGMCKEISATEEDEQDENEIHSSFFSAVRCGNKEFVMEMIRWNPDFLWLADKDNRRSIFHMAVEFRQEKIFDLIYGLKELKNMILDTDHEDNGILHIAGGLSPRDKLSTVAGAALKMQRELQWFKEVESIVPEMDKGDTNHNHLTGYEIFETEHEPLRKEAEEWMKGTATASSVVAALIATVTFQAVFTVPGGTDQSNGHPLHLKDARFMVFTIADTLSFFASCTSVLIFLCILAARYSFDDFLVSLPSKMIFGLSTLFVSVAAMLVAFSTALFTTLHEAPLLVIPVLPLACLPASLFVMLQFPLLKEMISSTFGHGIFKRDNTPWF
ncbi:PREDICTED: uncharacterized protein LOC104816462 [Tarenaya hassleriana]|uniref:uncharacterized protein LOC104816462 n=1 Tax=Tarenaya hassleriana TaxID=28532 RepID=UPI0008FD402F|nr:PREDICTED: uncharacterized protein LOC104816462 [Tarenaya hassleriana]